MLRWTIVLASLLALTLGCEQQVGPEPLSRSTADNEAVAPTGQLPKTLIPQHYRLDLTIVPDESRFSGSVTIDLQIKQPVEVIWLHGKNLDVSRAELIQADRRMAARYQQIDDDGLAQLSLESAAVSGPAQLEIDFNGPFGNLAGLYKAIDDEQPYVFSQMEPLSAREAFPSFDEPAFKTPFDISVTTKTEYQALSNTAAVEIENLGGELKRVTYATTEKLPTYLVAFAVGPFDIVEWEAIPVSPIRQRTIPLRGIATRGKGEQLSYALEHTAGLLTAMEEYFGTPYPYDKIDIVAVPDFGFGAMENPGLITYREQLLLLGDNPGLRQQRAYASVHAHELAHQWFGNLVTMPWWDDIWLNESFATWMGDKTVHAWRPEYQFDRSLQGSGLFAMGSDSLVNARQIREPVSNADGVLNAFDGITYAKGGAVLAMIESYLGVAKFRQGIQTHMQRHAHGNATVFDLMDSLETANPGRPVAKIFESFLFQAGVPIVAVELICDANTNAIQLSQSRYLPHGSNGNRQARWTLPVCFSYGLEMADQTTDQKGEQCVVFSELEQRFELNSPSCPQWIMPNRNGDGYYRWRLGTEQTARLRGALSQLNAKEKRSFADSLKAAYESNEIAGADLLAAAPTFAAATERRVATSLAPMLSGLLDDVVSADNLPAARRWLGRLYRDRLQSLREGNRESDSEGTLLESALISRLALDAKDPQLRQELITQARKGLGLEPILEDSLGEPAAGDPTAGTVDLDRIDPDLLRTTLTVFGQQATDADFETMRRALTESRSARHRGSLIAAMTQNSQQSNLRWILDAMMAGDFRTNEIPSVTFGLMAQAKNRDFAWRFIVDNIDSILDLLPRERRDLMIRLSTYYCDDAKVPEIKALFEPRLDIIQGGPRTLAQSIESIELCSARREAQSGSVNRFFSSEN